ncbi:hypothetical protein [Streptomyces sp. NPDC087300]|uniref:hypothetical protein n=1 Tax=Streptomyces sp. NPDC087300 TaxID=3365780 RepID=UPI00381600A5
MAKDTDLVYETTERVRVRPEKTFVFDGREITATCPKQAVWADLLAAEDEDATDSEVFRAVRTFLLTSLDDDDSQWFRRRLRDRRDSLEYDDIAPLLHDLIEIWAPYMEEQALEVGTEDVAVPADRRRPANPAKRTPAKTPPKRGAARRSPARRAT